MMKNSVFFFALFCLVFTNCKTEKPTTTLTINLAGTGPDKLEVINISEEIYHQVTDSIGNITLDLKAPVILDMVQRRDHHYIHVKPGDNLTIDTLSTGNIALGIRNNPSTENDYLMQFSEIVIAQSEATNMREMAKKGVDSFMLLLNQKYAPLAELMTTLQSEESVDAGFKGALAKRMTALKGNDLMVYKPMHDYYNKVELTLPDNFYAELAAIDFSDPALLLFEDSRRMGITWASKDISFKDYPSVSAYYAASGEAAKKLYGNSLLKDYTTLDNIYNNVNFGGGIDDAGPMIDTFKSTVTNKYMLAKVAEYVKPWVNLKSGLEAPNFVAKKRDDLEVQLSSLKGKKVYIDVWATWCGPCIREIPALKELEAELHEAPIEFVSVSIDQLKDKEKWLDFIDEKELSGLQLFADGDWQSDLTTSYNIKGIPRFLLIDEAGKIISANAPRPSDPSIRDVLLN